MASLAFSAASLYLRHAPFSPPCETPIRFVGVGKRRASVWPLSFAQLRDEEAALKAELKSRCVVCGISRNEFDRGGNVFYDHVTHDHCM